MCPLRRERGVIGPSGEAAIRQTTGRRGQLGGVFANAGFDGVWAPSEELRPDEWARRPSINLTLFNPGASARSSSKAAQVALMKRMALELRRHDIRYSAVCPGNIETSVDKRTEPRAAEKTGIEVARPPSNPALRQGGGEVEQVADVCVFLASDLGRHVSGVELFVNDGASLLR